MRYLILAALISGCSPDAAYTIGRMHVYGDAPPKPEVVAYLQRAIDVTGFYDLPLGLTFVADPFPCETSPTGECAGEGWGEYIQVALPNGLERSALAHELCHYQLFVHIHDTDSRHKLPVWQAID